MTMEREKMRRMATTIDNFVKVFKCFALVGVCVCTIMIPLCLIFGEKMLMMTNHLEIGGLTLAYQAAFAPLFADLRTGIFATLISGIVICGIFWYGLHIMQEMLSSMKEGLPFGEDMPRLFKKLGIVIIAGSILSDFLGSLASNLLLSAYKLNEVLSGSGIDSIGYNVKINLIGVFAGILVLFLGYVFSYGAQLQRESDETL